MLYLALCSTGWREGGEVVTRELYVEYPWRWDGQTHHLRHTRKLTYSHNTVAFLQNVWVQVAQKLGQVFFVIHFLYMKYHIIYKIMFMGILVVYICTDAISTQTFTTRFEII